ncbi:MAP7 domain-containing protein 2 isoform X2 [Denticeps clupeoides]|uniref:MAP7 domain-containing protein 2 isoform X2 n=1 Tax=Denticeps clupeoides TaxID=299321 RepID=UPI0010A452C6|nr:MAP7 domain-containing protein 2-like isoform X2 [Denticeps clupeoides]
MAALTCEMSASGETSGSGSLPEKRQIAAGKRAKTGTGEASSGPRAGSTGERVLGAEAARAVSGGTQEAPRGASAQGGAPQSGRGREEEAAGGGRQGDRKAATPSHSTGSAHHVHDPASSLSASSPARNVPDYMIPPESPDSPLSKRLSSSTAALPHSTERASPSPQRSPYRASPCKTERRKTNGGRTEYQEKNASANPAQGEKQCGDRGATLTPTEPFLKQLESPTTPTRCASTKTPNKNLSTPKRVRSTKSRTQSPCSPGQYPPSPMRHRATTPSGEEKGTVESRGYSTLERKTSRSENADRKIPKSTSKDLAERSAESPVTPTGKPIAGTTDAEEASRLLAERRRQARVQKELEEKQRVEEERLRMEELQRRQAEERERQQQAARRAEEERQKQEEERQNREMEERRQKERRWKEMQDQLVKEREEAFLRAQKEAERKRQEREMLKVQEEQERLQRKKRIEEIMKRTRKPEEPKAEDVQVEPPSPVFVLQPASSPLLETTAAAQANGPSVGLLEVSLSTGMKTGVSPHSTTNDSFPIHLEPLEAKNSGADDLSDGVQSMDVSPVSRDELTSIPDFSPVSEVENLLDLTCQASYPKIPPAAGLGDLNKNLIERLSSRVDSQLIQSFSAAADKISN